MKIILIIALFLTCCKNSDENTKFSETINIKEDKFKNININFTEKGKLKLIVIGNKLTRKIQEYSDERLAEFSDGFNAKFYDSSEKVETTIKALFCRINEKTRYMYMKDSVYITTVKGDTIKAKNLTWDNITSKFTTMDSIDIKRPNEHIKGIGFEGNSDLSVYKIFKSSGITQNKTILL